MSKEVKIALIGAVGAIIAAILGAVIVGIFQLRSVSSNQPSATPTAPTVTITPATTQSGNLAPSPTPTLITIKKILQFPCGECGSPLSLELQRIEINTNDNTSAFHFKVINNDTSSEQSIVFYQLSLQDDNGNTSPANVVPTTYLGPTNSEIVIGTFPIALKSGVHYTLSVTISSSYFKNQDITVSY